MSTTIGLNAELYRQLGLVADDKSSLKKILDYVKSIVAARDEEKEAAAREKAETLQNIREAFMEFKEIKAGRAKAISEKEFEEALQRDGYYN